MDDGKYRVAPNAKQIIGHRSTYINSSHSSMRNQVARNLEFGPQPVSTATLVFWLIRAGIGVALVKVRI